MVRCLLVVDNPVTILQRYEIQPAASFPCLALGLIVPRDLRGAGGVCTFFPS